MIEKHSCTRQGEVDVRVWLGGSGYEKNRIRYLICFLTGFGRFFSFLTSNLFLL